MKNSSKIRKKSKFLVLDFIHNFFKKSAIKVLELALKKSLNIHVQSPQKICKKFKKKIQVQSPRIKFTFRVLGVACKNSLKDPHLESLEQCLKFYAKSTFRVLDIFFKNVPKIRVQSPGLAFNILVKKPRLESLKFYF